MSTTLEHDALIYASDQAYIDTVVPFLREGIRRGEGTVVATHDRNRDAIARALGPMAGSVLFVPGDEVYQSPRTAIGAYHNVLATFRSQGRASVRAIGEVVYGETPSDHERWLRYESIAHSVFEDAPLHVICPYDARALPGRIVEHARRTHPHLAQGPAFTPSDTFTAPEIVLRMLPESPSFDIAAPPQLFVDVRDGLAQARRALSQIVAASLPAEQTEAAMIAIGETLANGMRHGVGPVSAAMWTLPEAIVCSVQNEGPPIEDLCAGYRPPRDPENGGMGLWLARQLADEMSITHDGRGPIVTLAFARP